MAGICSLKIILEKNFQKRKFDGTHIPKKEKNDGGICDLKTILELNFLFRKIFPRSDFNPWVHFPKQEILIDVRNTKIMIVESTFLFW